VSPTTLGTATCGGPEETTIVTELPLSTCAPAAGDWLRTVPAGTVALDAFETVPTRPAPMIASSASVCVRPTVSGMIDCDGPIEITRSTALPALTRAPAPGAWLITSSAGTKGLVSRVIVPIVRPAAISASDASACRRPVTSGTVTTASDDAAGTISTAERFQRSPVGAVSLMVATVPAFGTAAASACTQNVLFASRTW